MSQNANRVKYGIERVMGYYRPVDQWNVGKRQEFNERYRYSGGDFG